MNKIVTLIMYLLWIFAIVLLLATTFTDFQYEDLNVFAAVFFIFAVINSFLVASRSKK